jgi:hypothetical protein
MAAELGYSNVTSASNAWLKVSRKILGANIGASPTKASSGTTPKKTPTKNGREGDDMESPNKRHKATKSRYITLDESDEQQDDGDHDADEALTGGGRAKEDEGSASGSASGSGERQPMKSRLWSHHSTG